MHNARYSQPFDAGEHAAYPAEPTDEQGTTLARALAHYVTAYADPNITAAEILEDLLTSNSASTEPMTRDECARIEAAAEIAAVLEATQPAGPTTYIWTVELRHERQGFTKSATVAADTIGDALVAARAGLNAQGYDSREFDATKVERGTIAAHDEQLEPVEPLEELEQVSSHTLMRAENTARTVDGITPADATEERNRRDNPNRRRPADEDKAGGRNTITRFADPDEATPEH